MIKLYNTLSRKKEEFKPLRGKEVRIYTCGPTVYNYAHIGNLRAYIFADTLRRILELNSYKINQIVNITDVGHLTSDADEGEDKVEKEAKEEQKTPEEIAKFYTEVFLKNLKSLNIEMPERMPKATDNIKEMIKINEKIEKNGYAYETEDGLYFDTSQLKDYGILSKQKIELERKPRVGKAKGKKNPTDFALWLKAVGEHKNHLMQWDSPWGKGFPGWHIECTAMSEKYLGEVFDIHTGGIDHIPVHHENEIAQSIAAFGEIPARFFMHSAFLTLGKEKMAKSRGNLITLDDVVKKGFGASAFRFLCLNNHYRSPMLFDWQKLKEARSALSFLYTSLNRLRSSVNPNAKESFSLNDEISKTKKRIKKFFFNDLNIPKAIDELFSFTHYLNELSTKGAISEAQIKFAFREVYQEADRVLAINIAKRTRKKILIPQEIKIMAIKWRKAKEDKNYDLSDSLREKALKKGYKFEDLPDGKYRVVKK